MTETLLSPEKKWFKFTNRFEDTYGLVYATDENDVMLQVCGYLSELKESDDNYLMFLVEVIANIEDAKANWHYKYVIE
jgi:hypothetical protein